MDFVTRQFIVLAKKLRDDVRKAFVTTHSDLQRLTESIRQYHKAAEHRQDVQPPIQVFAELHTPENVERTRSTHEDRQHKLQVWVVIGTWLAFLAASIYAYVAVRQWREMIAARHKMQDSIDAANRSAAAAERANTEAANVDRPWFGTSISVDGFEIGNIPVATIVFANSGRRPAKVIVAEVNSHWFRAFPANPPYEHQIRSVSIVVPNSVVTDKFNVAKNKLSKLEIDTATAGNPRYFIHSNIQYVDIGTGAEHHTHSCWTYIGNDPVLAKGFYNCTEYQDAN